MNQETMSQQELDRHKRMLEDAIGMTRHIPHEVRTVIEDQPQEVRDAILQLQLVAIQYGRALERRDQQQTQPFVVMKDPAVQRPSTLALKLVDRAGQEIKQREEKVEKLDRNDKSLSEKLLIVPGQHLPTMG